MLSGSLHSGDWNSSLFLVVLVIPLLASVLLCFLWAYDSSHGSSHAAPWECGAETVNKRGVPNINPSAL